MWQPTIKSNNKCATLKHVIDGAKCNKKTQDGERYCADCWNKLEQITSEYKPEKITVESLYKAYLERCND